MLLERRGGVGDLRQPGADLLIKTLARRRQHLDGYAVRTTHAIPQAI